MRLKQASESAECEAASEIAPKGAPSAVSFANIILLNTLPLPSLGASVEMITVELEAIFYKAAQQKKNVSVVLRFLSTTNPRW